LEQYSLPNCPPDVLIATAVLVRAASFSGVHPFAVPSGGGEFTALAVALSWADIVQAVAVAGRVHGESVVLPRVASEPLLIVTPPITLEPAGIESPLFVEILERYPRAVD
jgi:hypothetical protein